MVANNVADLGSRLSSLVADSKLPSADEVARLVEERRRNIRKANLQTKTLFEKARKLVGAEETGTGISQTDIQRGVVGGRQSGSGIESHQPTRFLGIGTGGGDAFSSAGQHEEYEAIVAESPTAVDFDIYDRAYQSEVERIQSLGGKPTVYATNVLERGGLSTVLQNRQLAMPANADAA